MNSNPFATRFIRPGAIAFLFPPGTTALSLVDQLRHDGWQGQIVGPHGSGKSTLLAALVPALQSAGRRVVLVRVQGSGLEVQRSAIGGRESGVGEDGNGERDGGGRGEGEAPAEPANEEPPAAPHFPVTTHLVASNERLPQLDLDERSQLLIDGFEQLSWTQRRRVKQQCRKHGAGLLVTAHRDLGLPTLYRTQPSVELAQAVVHKLLPPGDTTITSADVARAYQTAQADLREMLFALYDVYRNRRLPSREAQRNFP